MRIAAAGKREGFRVLTLAPAFQAYADQHKTYLHGFDAGIGAGHWNLAGHRLGGEMMAREVCSGLVLKQTALTR